MRFVLSVALVVVLEGCRGCEKRDVVVVHSALPGPRPGLHQPSRHLSMDGSIHGSPVGPLNGKQGEESVTVSTRDSVSHDAPLNGAGPAALVVEVGVPAAVVPAAAGTGPADPGVTAAEEALWLQAAADAVPQGQVAALVRDGGDLCGHLTQPVLDALTEAARVDDTPARAWFKNAGRELLGRVSAALRVTTPQCKADLIRSTVTLATQLRGAAEIAGQFSRQSGLREFCRDNVADIRIAVAADTPWSPLLGVVNERATFASALPAFCPNVFTTASVSEVAVQQVVLRARVALRNLGEEYRYVRRSAAFTDSLGYLHGPANRILHPLPHVAFSEDGPGALRVSTLRDWFVKACFQVFTQPSTDPAGGLFKTATRRVYQVIDVDKPFVRDHWVGVGELLGLAIAHRLPIGVPLPAMFYARLLRNEVRVSDLARDEVYAWRSLKAIQDGTLAVEDLGIFDDDQVPSAADYIAQELAKHMTADLESRFSAMREGLNRLIPVDKLKLAADPVHLSVLLAGTSVVDVEEMKRFTTVQAWGQDISRQVEWLWQWLAEKDEAMKMRFVQWVTGFSQLPVNGFAGLPKKITINPTDGAIMARTCFLTMDMPPLGSLEDLKVAMDFVMEDFAAN